MTDEDSKQLDGTKGLVVVGASAGGIEALSAFVAGLPVDLPVPVVIAQHLSPHRKSVLEAILQKRTSLPVMTVETLAKLKAGTIYVVPANRDVLVIDHEISVIDTPTTTGKPSVDLLFRSAAEEYRENLIAIVLSGTGSDGASGAQEVKDAGGTVIIQNPASAAFPGMPRSLPSVIVDLVVEAGQMGAIITDLLAGGLATRSKEFDAEIHAFLSDLRDSNGIDFTNYKQPTIRRQLQRRMTATGHHTLEDYVAYADADASERQQLIKSFLINVTEFFRDKELFDYLKHHIIPELAENAKERDTELRIWSAGCSTGEEAYSLAIIISDYLLESGLDVNVRIFATDLDNEAVAFARKGIYSARSLANVPDEIVERYFSPSDGNFEVNKELRSMIVFGEHGLGQQAPFPRIDLVFCRNVLIYFTVALQRRALQLFAYSLISGGYLVVDKSESVGPLSDYFVLDNSRFRVFRRLSKQAALPLGVKDVSALAWTPASNSAPRLPLAANVNAMAGGHVATGGRTRGKSDEVLQRLTSGVVLIDEHYDIQMINATARRFFAIHSSAVGEDFLHQVTTFDVVTLRRAVDQAFRAGSADPLLLSEHDQASADGRTLHIAATALSRVNDDGPKFVMLQADDVSEREHAMRAAESARVMLNRVTASNEEILQTNLELTSTIAALRVENEEFFVAAEEVQAAAEEMETLNEELHATNEELETLNEELQATAEELNIANDDLQARSLGLQELAGTDERERLDLETILFEAHRPIVVIGPDGDAIFRNEAFSERFEASNGTLRSADGSGERMSVRAWLTFLSGATPPYELGFVAENGDSSEELILARGHVEFGTSKARSFTVVEIEAEPPGASL